MAMPMNQLPDDLLPPELAIDQVPISDADLDEFLEHATRWAAATGLSVAEYVDMAVADAGDEEDHTDVMPPAVRAFISGELDPERAEWAMARVRASEVQLAADVRQRDTYIDRIRNWFARAEARAQGEQVFFRSQLTAHLRRLHEADPKVKSISLPSGKITSTGPTPGNEQEVVLAELPDSEEVLIEWIKANLEADEAQAIIKVTEKVLLKELRKHITVVDGVVTAAEEGGAVPGLAVRTKVRKFDVKPGDIG